MQGFCRKAVDEQRARSRTAEAQKKQLADMLKKDEIDLQGLKNELADKKEELNAANRKLHTLKGNEGLVSQPSLPLPVRCTTASSNGSSLMQHQKDARGPKGSADYLCTSQLNACSLPTARPFTISL